MEKMNINLSRITVDRLRIEAQHRHTSVSAVIRLACNHLLDRHAASSGAELAQRGNDVWDYMWEVNGVYVIYDSAGNVVSFGSDSRWLNKRGSGSAGWQKCDLCGEMFDAGIGSYFNPPVYLCGLCGEDLLRRKG